MEDMLTCAVLLVLRAWMTALDSCGIYRGYPGTLDSWTYITTVCYSYICIG